MLAGVLVVGAFPVRSWLDPRPHLPSASPGAPPFERPRITWAVGDTVHYGERSFDIGGGAVTAVTPSPYGLFVEVLERPSLTAGVHTAYVDGRSTTRLPGDPLTVQVSLGGRYAAWADLHGPRRVFGRIAQVVVLDLRSGTTVFHTSEGMGGMFETNPSDRYSEQPPTVLGFDTEHVYWTDAQDRTHRWRLASGAPQRVRTPGVHLRDPTLGTRVTLTRGRVSDNFHGGAPGVLSPDGRSAVDVSSIRLRLTDPRTGRVTPLRGLDRSSTFGGWLPDSSFYALTDDSHPDDPDARLDRIPGRLVRCVPATGACTTSARVPRAREVVLPGTLLR